MASSQKRPQHLQPLTTNPHNKSLSSIASEAATFHSVEGHQHLELQAMSPALSKTDARPTSPSKPLSSPKFESLKMSRQDSGFEEGIQSASSSRRTSTSSSRNRASSKHKRRSTASSGGPSRRPSTKRAGRSTPAAFSHIRNSASTSSARRPSLHMRHTTPYSQLPHAPTFQFFQFPTLSDPQEPDNIVSPTPPPATVQYWTSDSTRRLEYAAIDAASQGFRGFFIKLLPDCILPASSKRMRFHEDDGDSDAGSVRRYRLALPEEKETRHEIEDRPSRPGIWRRMTSFGRRSRSC